WMYETFQDAPVLGSLLDPKRSPMPMGVSWEGVGPLLGQALQQEQSNEQQEAAVVAQGLTKAATLLAGQYSWVITNVPYLARRKQDERLCDFCEKHYPAAKNDLATVFLDRCLELCVQGGTSSIVLPQNWLFLTSYKKFREKLLKNDTWHLIVRLGGGAEAFNNGPGNITNICMITLSRGNAAGDHSGLFSKSGTAGILRGVDVSAPRTPADKAAGLITTEIKQVEQVKQLENPDARVTLEEYESAPLLSEVADYGKGSTTGDAPRFLLFFWEVNKIQNRHVPWLNSPTAGALWSGRSKLCTEPIVSTKLTSQLGCWLRGQSVWGRSGVVVNKMSDLEPFLYAGEVFDDNICPICPKLASHIPAIFSFVESGEYSTAVRCIDQKLNVTAATLVKVPFNLDYWTKVAAEKYPNGLPRPYSDDPSQWLFHGHPAQSDAPLQVAVARLLGYHWPTELDPAMELSAEARAWVQKSESLLPLADEDGIVCLPPVRGEMSAADRLENLLAASYGNAWSATRKSELLAQADHGGKTLETWLREKFFSQHCKLFQHRPFIWHIWDGLRDGFAALINYHKLDHKLLETLIYTYLGDWISRQKQDIAGNVDGAQEKLAAAESLKKNLELILEGEAPYDIFVRWKPLTQQPIGWNPDLNDGVRLNIRPFLSVPDVGKRGAGVLRDKPNIKWEKDRGKDVKSAPWFHLWGGDRINDHHLTLAEKRAVRETAE
ncbi:MAG: N-6 DNA methylase, partial [Chlorobium sp.]|nr:N-6 DNA methylase [Chlorobium sp.]